ncbi:hypothetical protein C8J56DRAFT_839574 [Mycena floridula]|nr:hypothetical protein C8J56DRAFT_839574 [Mycena floridula]
MFSTIPTIFLTSSTGKTVKALPSTLKHVRLSSEMVSLRTGDLVELYGKIIIFDEQDSVPETTAKQWRQQSDPLCDSALEVLFDKPDSSVGVDLYTRLETYINQGGSDAAVLAFWSAIQANPPDSIAANIGEIKLGRELFLDTFLQGMQALLYYSLAGGFASPRIVRSLEVTSYLMGSPDRTFTRLLETFQFVLDVMDCQARPTSSSHYLSPGGDGWKSAVRVRMLHGIARSRIRSKKSASLEEIPISQEDMSATLASFSTIPLWALSRLGITSDRKSLNAFIALWRHVGFYLGVDPAILSRYFCDVDVADHFLASIALHAFSPDGGSVPFPPTMPILLAVSNRGPLGASLEFNCAAARFFLGPELATYLNIPETTWMMWLKLHLSFALQKYPVIFGRTYGRYIRTSWVEKRRKVSSQGMARSLRNSLGMRQTVYRPNGENSELENKVKEEEAVIPDFEGAKVLRRLWKEVIFEMVVVSLSGGFLISGVLWWTISRII